MKNWWPFGLTISGLALRGKDREVAKAYYELSDENLERRLLNLSEKTEKQKKLDHLKLDRKYKKISKKDFDYQYVDILYAGKEDLMFVKLKLDLKYGKITEPQFHKSVYSLRNLPWVGVIKDEYDPKNTTNGFMLELDWNDAFVDMLKKEGYTGQTDDEVVEQWFESKAAENYMEIISEKPEIIDPDDMIPRTRIRRNRNESGKTEHS